MSHTLGHILALRALADGLRQVKADAVHADAPLAAVVESTLHGLEMACLLAADDLEARARAACAPVPDLGRSK